MKRHKSIIHCHSAADHSKLHRIYTEAYNGVGSIHEAGPKLTHYFAKGR